MPWSLAWKRPLQAVVSGNSFSCRAEGGLDEKVPQRGGMRLEPVTRVWMKRRGGPNLLTSGVRRDCTERETEKQHI